jgi:hypothetical protein
VNEARRSRRGAAVVSGPNRDRAAGTGWSDAYLPAVQGIARATVRARREDPRMARWLEVIATQGEGEGWVRWARERGTAAER